MTGWEELPRILLDLAVAFALGIPVGWDRERQKVGPGLRTYPLLAMGACAYLEIGQFAFRDDVDAQARVFQALVSGIGFIGAGAIMKGRAEVHGLATAVSLWITVSVGIAASYGGASSICGKSGLELRYVIPIFAFENRCSGLGYTSRPFRLRSSLLTTAERALDAPSAFRIGSAAPGMAPSFWMPARTRPWATGRLEGAESVEGVA